MEGYNTDFSPNVICPSISLLKIKVSDRDRNYPPWFAFFRQIAQGKITKIQPID
jgi:hypothetical protein